MIYISNRGASNQCSSLGIKKGTQNNSLSPSSVFSTVPDSAVWTVAGGCAVATWTGGEGAGEEGFIGVKNDETGGTGTLGETGACAGGETRWAVIVLVTEGELIEVGSLL